MTDELLKLVVRKNELYVEWKTTAVDDPLFEQRIRNFRTYDNMIKLLEMQRKLIFIILLQCIKTT